MSTVTTEALESQLDRLAAFEPTSIPVISLYLKLQAYQYGRDNYHAFPRTGFLRKDAGAQAASTPGES